MSKFVQEKSKMQAVEFASLALRDRIAPPSFGSVKARRALAARKLKWRQSRVDSAWYADPRMAPSPDEIADIEALSGLTYARRELHDLETLIASADALLDRPDADFYRPFVDAVRAMARAFHRP
jgi:hypothetical protein